MGGTAIVHDYLTQSGGAERVALALADTFDAPIYTSVYQPDRTFPGFRDRDIRTTGLQRLVPDGRFRWSAPLLGPAFERLDLGNFDRVVVSTSGFAHHVVHPNAFVYCHTPPRFIYDLDRYSSRRLLSWATKPFLPWLRGRDQKAALRHPQYVANSAGTALRIQKIYGKQVDVIHPVLNTDHLSHALSPLPVEPRALMLARLLPYKRIDLAIAACALAGIPLTVAGSGPDEARLRSLVKGNVVFTGHVSDRDIPGLFESHSVVLVPGEEDFGLSIVEANFAGRPVVARAAGGALETVTDKVTGRLVTSQDVEHWARVIGDSVAASWDVEVLRASTTGFQLPAFQQAIGRWTGSV